MSEPITLSSGRLSYNPAVPKRQLISESILDAYKNNSSARSGWRSTGYGIEANKLLTKALKAQADGDIETRDRLEREARYLMDHAEAWKPKVSDFTDIRGVGDAVQWFGGSVGGLRSSVAPLVGGLAGAVAGAPLGPVGAFVGGAADRARSHFSCERARQT